MSVISGSGKSDKIPLKTDAQSCTVYEPPSRFSGRPLLIFVFRSFCRAKLPVLRKMPSCMISKSFSYASEFKHNEIKKISYSVPKPEI